MSRTITLEADVNTVDTATNLTAQGSVAAPSRVLPRNITKITGILAAVSGDGAAEGSGVFFIRLGGTAVRNGEQTLMFACGQTNTVQTGSDAPAMQTGLFKLMDADIAVDPSEVIDVQVEMAGEDLGDTCAVVTLIFG